jgi:hypothetical protein
MRMARRFLFFLLLGKNSLQYVARLGDMREVNFGSYRLGRARRYSASVAARAHSTLKMRTHLLRFVRLQGTGMGFACAQAKLRQNVKNLPALDFHLACEIVDTNLTHPPLFRIWFQST